MTPQVSVETYDTPGTHTVSLSKPRICPGAGRGLRRPRIAAGRCQFHLPQWSTWVSARRGRTQGSRSLDVLAALSQGGPHCLLQAQFPTRQRGLRPWSQSLCAAWAQLGSLYPKGASRRVLRAVAMPRHALSSPERKPKAGKHGEKAGSEHAFK